MTLNSHFRTRRVRRAFTLVELLVAVAIALLLVAIAIPALKLNLRGQSIREAARQINSFFDEARSQAALTGRPYGVIIERDGDGNFGNPRRAYRLFHVETPPPYCGDLLPSPGNPDNRIAGGSRAYIQTYETNSGSANFRVGTAHLTYANHRLVNPGDGISFDGRSEKFLILRTNDLSSASDPNTRLEVYFYHVSAVPPVNIYAAAPLEPSPPDLDSAYNAATPPPTRGAGHSFQVTRQPIKLSSSSLELPRSAAIDLDWSGVGAGGVQFYDINAESGGFATTYALSPITILFTPTGEIKSVTAPWRRSAGRYTLEPRAVDEPIYLLVGRLDNVWNGDATVNWTNPADEFPSNIHDTDALWIKINPSNGMTLTVQNTGILKYLDQDPEGPSASDPAPPVRADAALFGRQLARISAGAEG